MPIQAKPRPLLFGVSPPFKARQSAGRPLGVPPFTAAMAPYPPTYLTIFGVTKDSTGSILPSCTVHLFRTADDLLMDWVVSDATTGAYEFRDVAGGTAYYLVAYLAGSPDVAGTTVNTLYGGTPSGGLITPPPALSGYFTAVVADNPTVLLMMDDVSGNLVDYMVGNDGVVSGAALTYREAGPDPVGIPYSCLFNTNAIVTIADSADIDLANGPFTLEMWLKRPAASNHAPLLKGDNIATAGYQLNFTSNLFRLQDGSGSNHISNTSADSDTTAFHHWVFNRASAATGNVYRDGTDVTNINAAKTFSDNNLNLVLGQTDRSNGWIAGLAIYKTQLSAGQVAAHYAARSS